MAAANRRYNTTGRDETENASALIASVNSWPAFVTDKPIQLLRHDSRVVPFFCSEKIICLFHYRQEQEEVESRKHKKVRIDWSALF